MTRRIHTEIILQDLYYEIMASDSPIILELKLKDIEVGDYILFEEAKWYLFFVQKTGFTILTKVIDIKPISNKYYIKVEQVKE